MKIVITGSSGQIAGGALNHPAMARSLNLLGSLVIDVEKDMGRLVSIKGLVEKPPIDQAPSKPPVRAPTAKARCNSPSRPTGADPNGAAKAPVELCVVPMAAPAQR
mgnify:CR=1 FL=1